MGCDASQVKMRTQDQAHAHSADCFLVNCMDFRLIDDMVHFMNGIGYHNNYDQFTLAGSSLGFTQDKYPHWGQALLDHMSIGLSLHGFRQIIFIDHADCGAYKKFYPDYNKDNAKSYHQKHIQLTYDKLAHKFPDFKFQAFLMNLKGECEEIKINQHDKIKQNQVKTDLFLSTLNLNGEEQQQEIQQHKI